MTSFSEFWFHISKLFFPSLVGCSLFSHTKFISDNSDNCENKKSELLDINSRLDKKNYKKRLQDKKS